MTDIQECNPMLTLGRYVGAAITEDDVPYEGWFAEMKKTLAEQFAEAEELNAFIQDKLDEYCYAG